MAMVCFFGMWALCSWLVRKCVPRSVIGINAEDRNDIEARGSLPRLEVPDTVPVESRRTGQRTMSDLAIPA
jgi:hypothetical protein